MAISGNEKGTIMPFYEYECECCGHRFDKRMNIKWPYTPVRCPKCGSGTRKVMSVVNHVMKGELF